MGVWARGDRNCELPEALDDYADALVGWNGESIIEAINGKSDKSYKVDGEPSDYRSIERFVCR